MCLFALAFLLGVCSVIWFSSVPSLWFMALVLCVGVALHMVLRRHGSVVRILWGVALGFVWVMCGVHVQQARTLAEGESGESYVVQGVVADFPKVYSDHVAFLFESTTPWKRNIQLSWYHPDVVVRAGQSWQLVVHLKRPRGLANPGGFDYEKWLFCHYINAVGYVVQGNNHPIAPVKWAGMLRVRQALWQRMTQLTAHLPYAEFLPAVVLCMRQGVTQEEWKVLEKTGTGHLIAIAGLHLGLIASFIFLIANFLWRRVPYLLLRWPAQKAATLASIPFALAYACLAGFNLPTERAFIMLMVMAMSLLCGRQMISWYSFSVALLLVLLLQPFAVLSASFWLSFSVVAGLVYALQKRSGHTTKWRDFLHMQYVITMAIIPCSLWFFGQISLVSYIANMIAVPWFALLILPSCFIGVLLLHFHVAYYFFWFALKNFSGLWTALQWLAAFPMATWQHPVYSMLVIGLLGIGVYCALSQRKKYAWVFFVPLIWMPVWHPAEGTMRFTLLDVGQGLSAVVQTARHVLVFDTGPKFGSSADAGERVVVPYLQRYGIRRIDMLMVSHPDEDHIGGAYSILQALPVDNIRTSVPRKFSPYAHQPKRSGYSSIGPVVQGRKGTGGQEPVPREGYPGLKRQKYNVQYCHAGQHWNWDGVDFQVVWPPQGYYDADNNSSCVLRVVAEKESVLLTGDIEAPAEKTMIAGAMKHALQSDVIVAPHHGSHTSSSLPFLQVVQPRMVLFPVGYRNRFHFPSDMVVQRYRSLGANAYDTARFGAITLRSNGQRPILYRISHHHIWTM